MSWHDDVMANDAAPILDEVFGDAAVVTYTSANGTAQADIDAILGAIQQQRINDGGDILREQTRLLKIKRSLLAAADLNGKFTIGGIQYGIVSKPTVTPTWWVFEIATADWMDLYQESMRDA